MGQNWSIAGQSRGLVGRNLAGQSWTFDGQNRSLAGWSLDRVEGRCGCHQGRSHRGRSLRGAGGQVGMGGYATGNNGGTVVRGKEEERRARHGVIIVRGRKSNGGPGVEVCHVGVG